MIIMIMSHHYDLMLMMLIISHDADDHYDADDQDLARHHLDPGSPPPNLSDQLQILRSLALLTFNVIPKFVNIIHNFDQSFKIMTSILIMSLKSVILTCKLCFVPKTLW